MHFDQSALLIWLLLLRIVCMSLMLLYLLEFSCTLAAKNAAKSGLSMMSYM